LSVEDSTDPLTISAVYVPSKHNVKQVQLAAPIVPSGLGSLQDVITMTNIPIGDQDLLHLATVKFSERWNN
jgi:hypothetical protein